jgi:SAM-dependent methyltransferase
MKAAPMQSAKAAIKRIPVIGEVARKVAHLLGLRSRVPPREPFSGSLPYWEERYAAGGTSGSGSYGRLAHFKAEVLNTFVAKNDIQSVIEFGCGDGNQLKLASYPLYVGVDVSSTAINLCRREFAGDASKQFVLSEDYQPQKFELSVSLDVIYHLVEDPVFEAYMNTLLDASARYVIIYASDFDRQGAPHVRHRKFSSWIKANRPNWALIEHMLNRYPGTGDDAYTSFSEFFIYELRCDDDISNPPRVSGRTVRRKFRE